MKQKAVWKSLYLVPFFLAVCLTFFYVQTHHTQAAINPYINFQGKLTNPDGTNLTNGSYSIVFSIYTVASGGSNVWTETKSVTVTDGIFQTSLGDTTALPGSVDFNTGTLYLGIKVGTDAEMTPRVTLTAAPYAFNSDKLGGISSTGYVQLSPGSQQTGFLNISGNATVGGTYNGNTLTSSALTFSAASAASIQSAAGQSLTLDSGTTGAVNLGTGASAKTITIGNTTAATTVATLVGAGTNAFSIQGAASAVYFQIDTTNNRVYVGNPTADATAVLFVLDTKNTAGDPTGVNGGSYYNSDLRRFRCYSNGAWSDCDGIPTPNSRRTSQLVYPGTGTVFSLSGDVATATVAGTSIIATTTAPAMLNFATTAVLNNVNSVSGNPNYDTDNRIRYQSYNALTVTTIVRVWLGITDQTAATMGASANPAGNYAAFRYDTSAADVNYQCVTKNNATQTIANSGIAPGTTGHKFEIMQSSTEVVFFIDGTRVCTNITTLPTANILTRYVNSVTTLEGVIKSVRTAWIYIESDY